LAIGQRRKYKTLIDCPQEELTKFGYRSKKKVENFDLSSTRGINQIWLLVKEESTKL
jgi:hypothetical protein